jgi:hypothetical protein
MQLDGEGGKDCYFTTGKSDTNPDKEGKCRVARYEKIFAKYKYRSERKEKSFL